MTVEDLKLAEECVGDPVKQSEFISRLMVERKWRSGRDHKALAPIWKMAVRTVGARALIAAKAVHLSRGDAGTFIAEKLAELDSAIAMGFERTRMIRFKVGDDWEEEAVPDPDLKAVIAAVRVQGEIMGVVGGRAKAPSKLDEDQKSAYKDMTPQQRIELHMKAVEEERAKMGETH